MADILSSHCFSLDFQPLRTEIFLYYDQTPGPGFSEDCQTWRKGKSVSATQYLISLTRHRIFKCVQIKYKSSASHFLLLEKWDALAHWDH